MSLGEDIKTRRRDLRLSVSELSKRAELSEGSIRAIEQGRRKPSEEALGRIERALDITFVRDEILARYPGDNRNHFEDKIIPELRLELIQVIQNCDEKYLLALSEILKLRS